MRFSSLLPVLFVVVLGGCSMTSKYHAMNTQQEPDGTEIKAANVIFALPVDDKETEAAIAGLLQEVKPTTHFRAVSTAENQASPVHSTAQSMLSNVDANWPLLLMPQSDTPALTLRNVYTAASGRTCAVVSDMHATKNDTWLACHAPNDPWLVRPALSAPDALFGTN